jgi:hypothetical protein
MKQARTPRGNGIGALELIEEAISMLRHAPLEVLALYYLGTLPFVMGALYFWADMSRSADAEGRLAGGSLGLALLFIWMKFWQARFCGGLSRFALNNSEDQPALGTVLTQAIFQPWGLVILPLALVITIPFGWCFAFFQNISVSGPEPRRAYDRARRQAALWPAQNHLLILIFLLLGLVVFANLCISAFFFPRILKTLFGVENLFTRSNTFLLNSTFWAAMAALTHVCVDPLVKGVYLLRCHYGDSLESGADLLGELRELRRSSVRGLALLLLVGTLVLSLLQPARAGEAAAGKAVSARALSAQKLDKSIEQVIRRPEFAWRLAKTDRQKEEMPGFLRSAFQLLQRWFDEAGVWVKRLLEWLADILPKLKPADDSASGATGFRDFVFPLMYGLLSVCLSVGAVLLWRQARQRRQPQPEPESAPCHPVLTPDLRDESVTADQLSQDRWYALARELLAAGERRLGLRALYLACLACLAQQRLIEIASFKSNRDYERELGRFCHVLPEVTASFSHNMALFERVWYGMHLPEPGAVESFLTNYQRIASSVRQG